MSANSETAEKLERQIAPMTAGRRAFLHGAARPVSTRHGWQAGSQPTTPDR